MFINVKFILKLDIFTQHAAEAENADNAAEQKRQMNKRVRYGEIVQVALRV